MGVTPIANQMGVQQAPVTETPRLSQNADSAGFFPPLFSFFTSPFRFQMFPYTVADLLLFRGQSERRGLELLVIKLHLKRAMQNPTDLVGWNQAVRMVTGVVALMGAGNPSKIYAAMQANSAAWKEKAKRSETFKNAPAIPESFASVAERDNFEADYKRKYTEPLEAHKKSLEQFATRDTLLQELQDAILNSTMTTSGQMTSAMNGATNLLSNSLRSLGRFS